MKPCDCVVPIYPQDAGPGNPGFCGRCGGDLALDPAPYKPVKPMAVAGGQVWRLSSYSGEWIVESVTGDTVVFRGGGQASALEMLAHRVGWCYSWTKKP